jgi:hypothetical protein
MTHDELELKVAEINARWLIWRDLLAWLAANVAAKEDKPKAMLGSLSQWEDDRIDQRHASTPADLHVAETMRREKDWIISAASRFLPQEAGEEEH